ncbi:MAG: hypothetical protein PHS57_07310 [Alphaproteobacteria bacterium]|nr:hypothetical protein [Alphaproteobacteria bacterium]
MSFFRRFSCLWFFALLAVGWGFCAPGHAAPVHKERKLGTFGAWRAYAYEEGGQTVCYMVTTQKKRVQGQKTYRTAYLMLTHRPIEASLDVFSYGAGALLDAKHSSRVRIGSKSFDLFSVRDKAWARDAQTDHQIAKSLVSSSKMLVTSVPSGKGAATIKDQFSLTGARAAYRVIGKACGLSDAMVASTKSSSKKTVKEKSVKKKAIKNKVPQKKAVEKKPAKKKVIKKKASTKTAVKKKTSTKKKTAKKTSNTKKKTQKTKASTPRGASTK